MNTVKSVGYGQVSVIVGYTVVLWAKYKRGGQCNSNGKKCGDLFNKNPEDCE